MNRTFAVLIAAAALLVAASCCCCGGLDWSSWDWGEIFEPTVIFETLVPPAQDTPTPEVTPVITRDPVGDIGAETEALLETTDVPVRDLHDLAIRLRHLPDDTPATLNFAVFTKVIISLIKAIQDLDTVDL